jgi:hypothetical protein
MVEEDNHLVAKRSAVALADQADAAVLSKLSKGDAERAIQREKRKEAETEKADPRENVNAFNLAQQGEAESIQRGLDDLVGNPCSTREEIHQAKSALDELRLKVLNIEKKAADASYFLSAYDVRATSDLAKSLKGKIDAVQKKVLPRRAFSFSRRKVMKERNTVAPSSKPTEAKSLGNSTGGSSKQVEVATRGMKVESKRDEVVTISKENATSDDIEIGNSTNCTFYVLTKLAVLRLVNLDNCKVFCGPVDGSLYLEDAKDSVVMAAAHQVRIHKSTHVDFYLRSRSYPIIEKCSDVRFAPYSFDFEGSRERLEGAKLGEENDLWSDVKDFGWLKSTPSPNWSILPVEQRINKSL